MDRGAWRDTVHGVAESGHDLAVHRDSILVYLTIALQPRAFDRWATSDPER